MSKLQRGRVLFLSRKGNYVFIRVEGKEERLFCHRSVFETADCSTITGTIIRFRRRKDDRSQVGTVRPIRETPVEDEQVSAGG